MADEDHALQPQRLDDCLDIAGQAADGPVLAILARLAVPRLIEGDDAVIAGEGIDLVLSVGAIAAPAVQEDEGGIALAADLADEVQAILGTDRFLGRFSVAGLGTDRR